MDTAERTIAEESSRSYDGFISYSHAADYRLAALAAVELHWFAGRDAKDDPWSTAPTRASADPLDIRHPIADS